MPVNCCRFATGPTLTTASDKSRSGYRDGVEVTECVLDAVARVPRGRVASYGDIGRAVGVGARHVGRILARRGHEVAWWRVTDRDGLLPPHLLPDAVAHWDDEGIGVRADGLGCRIAEHRVDPDLLIS